MKTIPFRFLIPFVALPALAGACVSCGHGSSPTVYAASSLTETLEDAAAKYETETGTRIQLRFGGSGSLALEIEHGAPADCFISADMEWMDDLLKKGLVVKESRTLLGWNHLVLVVPKSATASVPVDVEALPILKTIAIGDPETVPAGKYAKQALQQTHAWNLVQDKLVLAHDVRAALARVERRETEGAVVYATDAEASDKVKVAFTFPDATHDPIVYPVAVLTHAPHAEAAHRFLTWLNGPKGRAVFREHGLGGS